MSAWSLFKRMFPSRVVALAAPVVEPPQADSDPIQFVEVRTEDLTGCALAWAVMTADGWTCSNPSDSGFQHDFTRHFDCENEKVRMGFTPRIGGEFRRLIHKHAVTIEPSDPWAKYGNQWTGMCISMRDDQPHSYHTQIGPDPEHAGLRAIVGAILGETVSIPAVLLE